MVAAAALAALVSLGACSSTPEAIELVETAPIETSLDHPDLREAHEVWLEMIGDADETLDVAQFYVSNEPGSRLEPVIRAIEDAAARGVRVRILAERKFHKTYPETLDRLAAISGIEVRQTREEQFGDGILHAKYFVVDGDDVYLGSQNFDWRSLEHIQELGVRVRSPDLGHDFGVIFATDWAVASLDPSVTETGEGLAISMGAREVSNSDEYETPTRIGNDAAGPNGALVQTGWIEEPAAPTYPFRGREVRISPAFSPVDHGCDEQEWDLTRITKAIDASSKSIRIQLLTYKAGPDFQNLESALLSAASRGVRVQLLLSDWCKRKSTIGGLQQLARFPGIEIRLVTLPQWSGGFIPFARTVHAKYMTVDGSASWIGTSNWDRDYFYESRNVGLIVEGAAFAGALERFFDSTWNSLYAVRVDPDATYDPPRIGS